MPNRPAARLPIVLVALCAAVYLYRTWVVVWPFLFRMEGDYGHYRRAGMAILRGATPFVNGFDYPPLLPVLVVPLAALPLGAARVLLFLVSQACLIGAALCLVRPLGGDLPALAAVAAVWAASGTVPENLALGQVNPLLLLLLALAWRWDASRPKRAAACLGLAAAMKIWPGLLLAAYLSRERWRALATGLAAAAGAFVLPWLILVVSTAPPHLPAATDYWMGTPATLNLSLPAAALRGTYPPKALGVDPLPDDWRIGDNPALLHLAPWRRRLSVWVAFLVLAVGLFALAVRIGWGGGWGTGRGLTSRDRLFVLAALTALATFASPISWYHYQVFALPGIALLVSDALRRRAVLAVAGAAVLLVGLTHTTLLRQLAGGPEERAILAVGIAVPLLAASLFAGLVARIGKIDPTLGPAPEPVPGPALVPK